MEENIVKGKFAGFFTFKSKENKDFYIIQVLLNKLGNDGLKGSVVSVFVTEEEYSKFVNDFEVGMDLDVKVNANFETGRVSYKIVY